MKKPELERLLALQKFIITFSDIERVIHFKKSKGFISENDVEHSYSLALMGWFIAQSIPELDINKIIKYALVHDLVEVYAGDTYVFADKSEIASKKDRETKALKRIINEWKDFPEMIEAMNSYENKSDDEAKFVYALDKIMPMMLNVITHGHTWKKENIKIDKVHAIKIDKVKLSPEIEKYYKQIYKLMIENEKDWFN